MPTPYRSLSEWEWYGFLMLNQPALSIVQLTELIPDEARQRRSQQTPDDPIDQPAPTVAQPTSSLAAVILPSSTIAAVAEGDSR